MVNDDLFIYKGTICNIFRLKYQKTTSVVLYILLTWELTLSQMSNPEKSVILPSNGHVNVPC